MKAFCLFQTICKMYNSNTFKQRKRTPNMQQVTYLFIRNAEQDGLRDIGFCYLNAIYLMTILRSAKMCFIN